LLGPCHALLRPQFAEAREKFRARDGSVRRILVFFGGGDSRAEILKALEALRRLNKPDIAIDVVASCADRAVIDAVHSALPWAVVHGYVEDVASLMGAADLTLGAAGSTTWERCCLGLPAVTVCLAANQHLIGVSVGDVGAARHLGKSSEVTVDAMERAIRELIEAPTALARMSARALELVDGLGTTRVSTAMQEA
jgi:UDP-2,4-diacetamido-2,4,6-trideoxy-beta-L-altropyranose hydrolase